MVITILEAQVDPEKASLLEGEFKRAVTQLEPGIVQSFLLCGSRDQNSWKIMTVWQSRQALDAMRQTA